MALLTLDELKARVSPETYLRAFRRVDDESSGDTDAYAQTCVDDACNEALRRTQGYLTAQLDSQPSDPTIKRCVAAVALFNGVALMPSSGAANASPFEPAYKRALDEFDRMAADVKSRNVSGSNPIASTTAATIQNIVNLDGITRRYGEVADRKGGSSY